MLLDCGGVPAYLECLVSGELILVRFFRSWPAAAGPVSVCELVLSTHFGHSFTKEPAAHFAPSGHPPYVLSVAAVTVRSRYLRDASFSLWSWRAATRSQLSSIKD
jgi:hypothetical protein